MSEFKEYLTTPIGTFAVEADKDSVISIQLLQSEKPFDDDTNENIYTNLCTMQIKEYFDGNRRSFNFPYKFTGNEFQNTVWAEIARIPYGKTVSYKELAEKLNKPQAVRAIESAAYDNKLMLCIPCHRLTGGSTAFSGFSAGLKIKQQLLDLEKEPEVYTVLNYAQVQKKRGILPTNRITGRFIYDIGDILFETETDKVLSAYKTHIFHTAFDLSECSGFTLEADAFTSDESEKSNAPFQDITITFYNASDAFTTKALLSPGVNTMHFDINNMKFSSVYKIAVYSSKPVRNIKLCKLNVLDNYFRYKGQAHFYTPFNCRITDQNFELLCKISGRAGFESAVFPDNSQNVYNMKMPRRNTIFLVIKNQSTASKMKLYYKTTVYTEYCEENSVEIQIPRSSEYKAYYFNLTRTPGLEGRLMQFKIETQGFGDIFIREYSFEEEKPLVPNAGSISSCIAQNNEITITGFIKPKYAAAGGIINIYATSMADENNLPEGKELLTTISLRNAAKNITKEGNLEFSVGGISFQNAAITRLSSQFIAFLTKNGETFMIGERFYIENYMDYDTNPYDFCLPGYTVRVTDAPFNAKGNACTDDTDSIQAAIDTVWKQGGGTVIVPGPSADDSRQTQFYGKRYRITNLLLRSRVNLNIEKNAILWQSPIYRDYKYLPSYGHDIPLGNICWTHAMHVANLPTIQCANSEYVKITGFGKIRSVDTASEEGVIMPGYSTGCPDRIHQTPIAFFNTQHIELRDFELVRTNNYHAPIYASSYVYAANIKMHEVRCVSGDGFGLSKGTHHVALNRNFFQSNDDGVVLSGCYFDPRGLVWWKSRLGKHGGTRHVRISHSYMNSGGGKVLAFITWGTSDPNYEMQEISDITAYDNCFISAHAVGTWPDNPYNGRVPFDNLETDDYSPVKSVRIFNNVYDGICTLGPIKATDIISDCGVYSADNFQNGDFSISKIPNLSNWSYKRNKNKKSICVRNIDGKFCGVMQYFKDGDTGLYQGLHLPSGVHKASFELMTGETGVYIFAQNIRTGEIITDLHVSSIGKFNCFEIKFSLSEDADLYIGLRHPADMTSNTDFTALSSACMEEIKS